MRLLRTELYILWGELSWRKLSSTLAAGLFSRVEVLVTAKSAFW